MRLAVTAVDQRIEHGSSVIYIFCRDRSSRRYIIRDDSFEPYFYMRREDYEHVKWRPEELEKIKRIEHQGPNGEVFRLLDASAPGVKIITKLPKYVRELKVALYNRRSKRYPRGIESYEADIKFPYRYVIDKGITDGVEVDDKYLEWCLKHPELTKGYIVWSDKYCRACTLDYEPPLRKLFVDIECYGKVPKDKAKVPVIIIGCYDSFEGEYHVFYWRKDKSSYSSRNIHYYENERDMFSAFLVYLRDIDPDLIISFTKFDMAYLIKRMRKLKLDVRMLSSIGTVSTWSAEKISLGGCHYLDLNEIYSIVVGGRKFQTLDAISRKELGYGKRRLYTDIDKVWDSSYLDVIYYNLRDVLLIKNLDKELDLIEYVDTVRRLSGLDFNDAMYPSRVADISYLRLLHGKIALRTRPIEKVRRSYSGATVFEAKRGIYNSVCLMDFSSMYVNIIKSFNIGWNTFDEVAGEIEVTPEWKYLRPEVEKSWTVEILDKLAPLLEENKRQIEKAKKERDFDMVERLKRRRLALKSIVHGSYGFYGFSGNVEKKFPAARLYSYKIAESITTIGRTLLLKIKEIIESFGYTVIFGDTDSIAFVLKTKDYKEESARIRDMIHRELHKFISEKWSIDPSSFRLDIEDYFKRIIIFTKKRYAGLTVDGRKIYKGIELVRRDQSELTEIVQRNVLDMVFNDSAIEDIKKYVIREIEMMSKYPLEKIAITGILRQPRDSYDKAIVTLKAFEFARQVLGLDIEEGERFFYVYIKPYRYKRIVLNLTVEKGSKRHIKKEIFSDVAGFLQASDLERAEYPIEIDRDRMLVRTIKNKVEDILEMIGTSWKEVFNSTYTQRKSRLDFYL